MNVAAPADLALRVRPIAPGDATAIAELLEALGYPCTPGEAVERIDAIDDDPRQYVLVAEIDGAVCGTIGLNVFYSLARGAHVARVTAMVVAPERQRQGIGRRMLREVESLARRAGAIRLEVTSNPRRIDAHAFYHGCGYADGSRHFVKLLGD